MTNVTSPLVSVCMTTYNHQKYIEEAIYSILEQTFDNYELIIVNDGSTDATDSIIQKILKLENNPKIRYIYQENQGTSSACNTAYKNARGKYVAKMCGDDVCYPHRLERQMQFIQETGARIVFSWVDCIDDNSNLITGQHFASNVFNHPQRSQTEILKHFFFKFNYINAVTGMLETELVREAGFYCLTSIQLQDFDMWIKLAKKYEIYLLEEKLLKYRIRDDNGNLSAPHPDKMVRSFFEFQQIYRTFFDNFSIDLFKNTFSNEIKTKNFSTPLEYELEKAFIYLLHKANYIQVIGLEKLFHLLQDESLLQVAKTKYNFGLPDFYELTKNFDFWNWKELLFWQKNHKKNINITLSFQNNNQVKNIIFSLDQNDEQQERILNYFQKNQLYRAEIYQLFDELLKNGDLFIDLGSYIGYSALLASMFVGEQGLVWSFEPNKDNQERILENISLNKITNIKLFKQGFMTTLDQIFFEEPTNRKALKLIKIDAGGNELQILQGALQTIKFTKVPYILVEIDQIALENMESSEEKIRQLMTYLGYNARVINSYTVPTSQFSLLFFR